MEQKHSSLLKVKENIIFEDQKGAFLLLLEVDPYHFYAYWEITNEKLTKIMAHFGTSLPYTRLILRVYEMSPLQNPEKEKNPYFDVPVEGWKNKRYIEIPHQNYSYSAEIGLKLPSTNFYPIARSHNTIVPPQCSIIQSKEEKWLEVSGDYQIVTRVKDDQIEINHTKSSTPSQREIEEFYTNLPQKEEGTISTSSEISPEDIENVLPFQSKSPRPDQPFHPQYDFPEAYSNFMFNSYDILTSSSHIESISSTYKQPEKVRSSLLQYGVDVIIYGKVQPGALIYIDGDSVETQPDGTFSLRLNLTQGGPSQVPIKIISPEGEERNEIIPFLFQKIRKNGD